MSEIPIEIDSTSGLLASDNPDLPNSGLTLADYLKPNPDIKQNKSLEKSQKQLFGEVLRRRLFLGRLF
jgi:hypothetical protein